MRPPAAVAVAVWRALFFREAQARLSSGRGAWIWLLVQPLAHVAFLMALFSIGMRNRSVSGADFAVFLALGIMAFNMFRNPAQQAAGAIAANSPSFIYRQVKPVDTVLVRCTLEGLIQFFVLGVLMVAVAIIGFEVVPHDPLFFLATLAVLWMLGSGLGLVLSVGARLVPEIGRVTSMIFGPLYFLSGIFFRPEMAPPEFRPWLLLNPVLHGVECLRAATFPRYNPMPEVSLFYVVECALVLVFFGLAMHIRMEKKLAAR